MSFDRAAFREQEKQKIRTMLAKAEKHGKNAYRVALSLLDSGLDCDQILAAAKQAPADSPSEAVHRGIRAGAGIMVREPSQAAEEAWLKEAREAAEAQWTKAHAYPSPQRDARTAEQVALDRQFSDIAARAAGLTHDGSQKRVRCDALDGALFRQSESTTKRLLGK